MKKLLGMGGILVLLAIVSAQFASAADFVAPAKEDRGTVTIGSTQSHKNLYVAGAWVKVDGKTSGDLYATGGTVDVENDVEKDLVVAGGNITVDGKVGDDLRAAGGTIKINGPVAGDLLVLGGNIIISEKSGIGGDLVVAGGSVVLDAPVTGSIRVSAGSIVINSKVGGEVSIGEGAKRDGITFGPAADISGPLVIYGDQRDIVKKDGAKVSDPEYRSGRQKHSAGAIASSLLGAIVVKLLAMIIALLLVIKLIPRRVQAAVEAIASRPWSNLGIGLAALILTPILAFLTFVIVVGYYVGIVILLLYVLALAAAGLLAALFLGSWIIRALTKKPLAADWQAALIGALVMVLVAWVPKIGWAVDCAVFLMAFGALIRMAKARIHSER